jgi:hypothetical protein
MRSGIFTILGFLLLVPPLDSAMAGGFTPVENEFHWISPNMAEVPGDQIEKVPLKKGHGRRNRTPLGDMAYNRHFDRLGEPPPLHFLRPLKKGPSTLAEILGRAVLFHKTGTSVPLKERIVPSWGEPAEPYLLSIPGWDRVLVVYPYYLFGDKENKCVAEIYSEGGQHLATFDTLPTHLSPDHTDLLVSPERSGCCDSLKWSIRFYQISRGAVSEYGCPEGFCGDLLFTKLGENGPFFIALEIIGVVGGIGSSLQTNVYVIENDGTLSASGKMIHAVHDPNMSRNQVQTLSPYGVSNLVAMDPLPEKEGWLMDFGFGHQRRALKVFSPYRDRTPSVVFLLPKDPAHYGTGTSVEMSGQRLGNPPMLGIAEAGHHVFSVVFGDGSRDQLVATIKSDAVNILTY